MLFGDTNVEYPFGELGCHFVKPHGNQHCTGDADHPLVLLGDLDHLVCEDPGPGQAGRLFDR